MRVGDSTAVADLEALLPQLGPVSFLKTSCFHLLEADYVPLETQDLFTQPWKSVMPLSVLCWAVVVKCRHGILVC